MRGAILLLLAFGQLAAAPVASAWVEQAAPHHAGLPLTRGSDVGVWGPGSFENDGALDWLGILTEGTRLDPVADAFATVEAAEYAEAPDAEAAVAAAEIVAALLGRPSRSLPDEASAWVRAHPAMPSGTLVARASAALARIRSDSEVKDLWEEGDASEWVACMDDLARRLDG